jgi:hypothetical protein
MAEIKTKQTNADVKAFIEEFAATEQKKADGLALLEFFTKVTGHEAKMWGPTMIGFGQYHYKSERSAQEGDWPLVGFSPRKAAISLYVYSAAPGQEEMLTRLGKYKIGKGCIYANKLADIKKDVLEELIHSTINFLQEKFKQS